MADAVGETEDRTVVLWTPQPGPQTDLITCPVFECFYGGARGGGKTDGFLGDWAVHADEYGELANGLWVRREFVQLAEVIERSRQLYLPLGAEYNQSTHIWRFKNGAILTFAGMENDSDADKYHGRSLTRLYIEEAGNFPSAAPIFKLMATLRSARGVPCRFRINANPGGAGHHWLKERYIDPAPLGYEILTETYKNPFTNEEIERERVFIPAKVTDNKYLGVDYIANLQMVGSPALVSAWLRGDWNVIAGAFFPEFGPKHIIEPFTVPKHWPKFRSMDYGSARPNATYWWCVADSDTEVTNILGEKKVYPRNAMIAYREWYTYSGPNAGIKMSIKEIAEGIKFREMGETIDYGVIDPSTKKEEGGPSILETLRSYECYFREADNSSSGAQQFRDRLIGEDDKPMIYWFKTCIHAIRTIPILQHDERRMEEIDERGEDHAYDSCRYAAMSRPYTRPKQPVYKGPTPNKLTWDTTFGQHLSKMKGGKSWR